MENYMDKDYIASCNTVINYYGGDDSLSVPERLGSMDITSIGNGAFMESSFTSVYLPKSVKVIGERCFSSCKNLKSVSIPGSILQMNGRAFERCDKIRDIILYDVELSGEEYRSLKNASLVTDKGEYVLCTVPKLSVVSCVLNSLSPLGSASLVPRNIPFLFYLPEDDGTRDKELSLFEKDKTLMGFTVPSAITSEYTAFSSYIMKNGESFIDNQTEKENDRYVRVGKEPLRGKCVLITFDDKKTREEGDRFFITMVFKIGYFFFQTSQPVAYEGRKYYVYSRYYLGSICDAPLVRRDVTICTDNGVVSNKMEARSVYAKYKLLSII